MRTALLVTPDEDLRARLAAALADYTVFPAASEGEALRTLRHVEVELAVVDGRAPGGVRAVADGIRQAAPDAVLLAVGPREDDVEAVDFAVPATFTGRDLAVACRHAAEKHRLLGELAAARARTLPPAAAGLVAAEGGWDGMALAAVLKELSRLFTAGFDLPRALDIFLNAIGELVRPSRTALLLPTADGEAYRVAADRGFPRQLVEAARLSANGPLARWLATEGRPAVLAALEGEPEVARELRLLQGVVAVPLLAHGELVAILSVGQPVVGSGYCRRETETLFDLATQLATAIRDMELHHQLTREKEFTEQILAHMGSGVVSLGRDHRIGLVNRRAEEILGLPASTLVGEDLRALPSPLGDMLFATLRSGQTVSRAEIQLAYRSLWLEVSTYPVQGEGEGPLGAVLVFEDLTAPKELATQKRQAEQLQLLTRVVARIADEIKNPLVSINTFIELIGERYDDPDFRKHFSAVVRRDVSRMVQVFEKLAGLVTEGELNFATVDVHTVVEELVAAVDQAEEGTGRAVQVDVVRDAAPCPVKVDTAQLRKALGYLVRFLVHHSPPQGARVTVSVAHTDDAEGPDVVQVLVGSRTAAVPADKLMRLFDPVQMVQESLIDVGPAVSQRLVEALGGELRVRQGRHELGFLVTLPAAQA